MTVLPSDPEGSEPHGSDPDDPEELSLEDEADEEEGQGLRRPAGKHYMTRVGAERLHAELRQLLTVESPRITAEVTAAAAQGDRSENAEYKYGKRRLREIDRRLRFLQKRLDHAIIVVPSEQTDRSRVYFGATVTIEDEDERRSTFQIVGPDELDAKGGKVSMDSPMGRALLRRELGESFEVVRPRGPVEVTVVKIDYV